MNFCFCIEVDDADRIVSQLRNKQTMVRRVKRHVIDATSDFPQRDFAFELRRACISGLRNCAARKQNHHDSKREVAHLCSD